MAAVGESSNYLQESKHTEFNSRVSGGGGAPGFEGRVAWRLEPPRAHSEGHMDKGGSAGSAGAGFGGGGGKRAVLAADGAHGIGGGGTERGGRRVSVS
jgi:hypothetical protein